MEKKFTEYLNESTNPKMIQDKLFGDSGSIWGVLIKEFKLKSGDMDPIDASKFDKMAEEMSKILARYVDDNK